MAKEVSACVCVYVCLPSFCSPFILQIFISQARTEKVASPLLLAPLHLLNHPSSCLFLLFTCFIIATELGELQALYRDHRALTLLVDYRSAMKRSYFWTKSRPWLNVSVALPIVLEKQLGLDFEVKRNSDYVDHFTTHCRVIDSHSIGCNCHTSPLIRA